MIWFNFYLHDKNNMWHSYFEVATTVSTDKRSITYEALANIQNSYDHLHPLNFQNMLEDVEY